MRKHVISLLLIVAFSAAATLSAAYSPKERKDATKTWLKGFEYFEKADKALQDGQLRQANTLFKMAESIFEKVQTKYPKWNASLIAYRIKSCQTKLSKIHVELVKKNIKLTDTAVDRENLELKEKIDELTQKLNKTRKELSTTLYSLEAARREAARNVKASEETTNLLKEKNRLLKRCALLEADNRRLQKRGASEVSDKTGKELLDKTLLQLEELKKGNASLRSEIAKERAHFAKIAKEKVRVQYEKKLADDDIKKLKDQIEILNARIVENQTLAKKNSERLASKTEELKQLTDKNAQLNVELEKVRGKLKNARLKTNATAIVKQLENENELLIKDLELANLNLERARKNKKVADTENARLKTSLKKVRDSLAAMDEDRAKTTAALEALTKKLFISGSVEKKLRDALAAKKKECAKLKKDAERLAGQYGDAKRKLESLSALAKKNDELSAKLNKLNALAASTKKNEKKTTDELKALSKKLFVANAVVKKQTGIIEKDRLKIAELKKKCDELSAKYASVGEKEKEFAALSKRSIEFENKNAELRMSLKAADRRVETLKKESKQSAMRVVRLQEELKKLVTENAESNRGIIAENSSLKEKCKALTEQLAILKGVAKERKRKTSEATRKMSMLTEELVNTKLRVEKLQKRLATAVAVAAKKSPSPAHSPKRSTIKEPHQALAAGKLVELKRRNTSLISKIQELKSQISSLEKEKNILRKTETALSPTEKKRIEKMLDAAALAENEKKKEAAIWYYEKILDDDPDNHVALTKLAYAKAEKGDDEEAVKLINRALAKTPDDLELLQTLAVCYSRLKQYYKALGAAAKANAINPKNPVTQRYLGIICSHLGWTEAAKRQFKSSYKLDPLSSETAYNMAVLLLTTKGGLPEAKLWYDKAVQLGAQPDPKIEELLKK